MRCKKITEHILDNEAIYISSYPNIFYYSGFTSEDAKLVLTKSRKILFTDSRYKIQARLESPEFEVFDISYDFEDVIKSLNCKSLYFEDNKVTVAEYLKLQRLGIELHHYSKELAKPRQVKDLSEINKIKAAQSLTDDAFSYIIKNLKVGMSEKEVALSLEFFMRKNGASSLSFETICASGIRSAMPHGVASDKIIEKGDFVTLDFGCILDGYCSDMTRTVVMGTPDSRQKEIYDIVLKAQTETLKGLAAGKKCSDCDLIARNIIKDAGYGDNFGHGTGHSVGIEIHESPSLSPKSQDILTPGNIITVEPGIYIENFGGVRIEDLVQITSENVVNLTKSEKDLLII